MSIKQPDEASMKTIQFKQGLNPSIFSRDGPTEQSQAFLKHRLYTPSASSKQFTSLKSIPRISSKITTAASQQKSNKMLTYDPSEKFVKDMPELGSDINFFKATKSKGPSVSLFQKFYKDLKRTIILRQYENDPVFRQKFKAKSLG